MNNHKRMQRLWNADTPDPSDAQLPEMVQLFKNADLAPLTSRRTSPVEIWEAICPGSTDDHTLSFTDNGDFQEFVCPVCNRTGNIEDLKYWLNESGLLNIRFKGDGARVRAVLGLKRG